MIIGVCGLGNTGSMAVIDFLREYDEIYYNNLFHEFSLCYCPDGMLDLKHHVVDYPSRFQSSDVAINRFEKLAQDFFSSWNPECRKEAIEKTESFINSISQVKWQGTWGFRIANYSTVKKFIYKVLYKMRPVMGDDLFIKYACVPMRYSVRPENFSESARSYIESILSPNNTNNEKIKVIDQAFSGDNPEDTFSFFKDPYAIVVDRDPRDLYILSKYYVHAESLWIPTDDINDFIIYYKQMRLCRNPIVNRERVLNFQFEDLIYNYEVSKKKIEDYLGIDNHIYPKKYFKPQKSINNTQLFNDFINEKENIIRIEEELQEWLFDFRKYPPVNRSEKVW